MNTTSSKNITNNFSSKIKVGLVQHSCVLDREENLRKSIGGIKNAALRGAKLVVLSELHLEEYFCYHEDASHFDLAETIPGPSTDLFGTLAKELGIVIVTSLFEKRAPGIYHNTSVVLETDGSIAGKYRKMHIPDDPGYYEKFYFTPGDLGCVPINTSVGKLGILICWDQWFPEAARLMALAGADVLIYPTAIGRDPKEPEEESERQRQAWITIQRSHAIANGLPVISVNRVGSEVSSNINEIRQIFWGSSLVAGPQGELLSSANTTDEIVLVTEIDYRQTEEVRRMWPFLRDRRIDAYQDLLKRYL